MTDGQATPSTGGTETLVLTGVERSAPLWEMAPDTAAAAVERHHEIVGATVDAHGGRVVARTDDSVSAAFGSADAGVTAALDLQYALAVEEWPEGVAVRVRIGVGPADAGDAAHRWGGIRDLAHGGQTLVAAATVSLVADDSMPAHGLLVDRGVRRLRDLARSEHVYELRHGDLRQEFPPVRSLDVLPNNLPAQLTSFVGRSAELGELEGLLSTQRLVTLAGAGGCGKSRLAVQAAAAVVDRWPDGVWWVDLGSVTQPAQVAELTAATLRARAEPAGDPAAVIAGQLGKRRLLLCLDTCEHVLDAAARLVDTVLRQCPAVSVVATSREPLGVAGETVWRVPSLVDDEAVQLFNERAALVQPGARRSEAPAADVHTICRRLDGIPLAIELAAAWMRALTPAQIVDGLDDRFRLLTGGPRVATRRQQTLAASMEWSHDLLTDADRVVFRRLAVFAGGFTLDAAAAVCSDDAVDDDVLTVLGRLVDKSLVVVTAGADQASYRMQDTIRQYADQRLRDVGEAAAIRDRHLDYFLALAETAEPEMERDQDTWRQTLDRQHDNILAALQWGLSASDAERGRRLAAAMARQWFVRGQSHEGLEFLERALTFVDDRSPLQARLLCGVAMLGMVSGRLDAVERAEEGMATAAEHDDGRIQGRCLAMWSYRFFLYDFERCCELAREAHDVGVRAGDPFARDWALVQEAYTYITRDRHDDAVALAREAADQSLPRGDRFCAAFARGVELWAALATGDIRGAVGFGEESVRIAEPLGNFFAHGTLASNLAFAKAMAGDIDDGRRLMEPIVRSIESQPDVDAVGFMVVVGQLHLWSGDLDGAVAWLERGSRFAAPDTDNWTAMRSLPGLTGALRRLGRIDEAVACVQRGVPLAKALDGPLLLADMLDEQAELTASADPRRAENLHHEALAIRVDKGLRTQYVVSLDALASAAARIDSVAEAVRLLAASDRARADMGHPRPPVDRPDHEALVERLRAALAHEFDAVWEAGAGLSLDDAVAYATRARGERGRPSSGWGSLTPTELDVVSLVVDGLTNPEIASRLFVSRATVKTHLSHIYAKLGVANRTELAAAATERER
ncbi:MAG TPA: LuxR C-terminal-related transcriptional regulator [Nocardioidaceae bacterium]|nr:LuxR C-terminal-related transcriptional regulator [Nocardioidaceae bacterium]